MISSHCPLRARPRKSYLDIDNIRKGGLNGSDEWMDEQVFLAGGPSVGTTLLGTNADGPATQTQHQKQTSPPSRGRSGEARGGLGESGPLGPISGIFGRPREHPGARAMGSWNLLGLFLGHLNACVPVLENRTGGFLVFPLFSPLDSGFPRLL